jgi:hypothetical protein
MSETLAMQVEDRVEIEIYMKAGPKLSFSSFA